MVKLAAPLAGAGAAVAAPAVAAPALLGSAAVSAVGTVGMVASSVAMVGAGTLLGPIGWVCLGCSDSDGISWDCWKDVVREVDPTPSRGRRLRDVVLDESVTDAWIFDASPQNFSLRLKNRWGETFQVSSVMLPDGQIAAHAEMVRC